MNDQAIDDSRTIDPSPDSTRRRGVDGVLATLGDGREWTLAYAVLDPAMDAARDYLHDVGLVQGYYDREDDLGWIRTAALTLLMRAHHLPMESAFDLLRLADPERLVPAVEAALLGITADDWTYSMWARVSLRSNGIDPDLILPLEVRPTLDALEALGKTLPKRIIPAVRMAERRR